MPGFLMASLRAKIPRCGLKVYYILWPYMGLIVNSAKPLLLLLLRLPWFVSNCVIMGLRLLSKKDSALSARCWSAIFRIRLFQVHIQHSPIATSTVKLQNKLKSRSSGQVWPAAPQLIVCIKEVLRFIYLKVAKVWPVVHPRCQRYWQLPIFH